MKLYHGSNVPVTVPDLQHSKPYKDFGRGFYLSADRKQAVEMGEQKLSQIKQGSVISLARLIEELRYPKGITFQYFFGTERAIQLLKKL